LHAASALRIFVGFCEGVSKGGSLFSPFWDIGPETARDLAMKASTIDKLYTYFLESARLAAPVK
jgi:hypothetical protein